MSENLEKRIRSRSIQKHDLEVNWIKATGFIPYKGEFIIYDIEVDKDGNTLKDSEEKLLLPEGRTEPYTYARVKIGDGIHTVIALPFVDTTSLKYIEQKLTEEQKAQARVNIDALGIDALANVVQYDSNSEISVNTHTEGYYSSLSDCLTDLSIYSSNAASCMDIVVAANTAASNAYIAADEVLSSYMSSNASIECNPELLVVRSSSGQIKVPLLPDNNDDAASKYYIDKYQKKISNRDLINETATFDLTINYWEPLYNYNSTTDCIGAKLSVTLPENLIGKTINVSVANNSLSSITPTSSGVTEMLAFVTNNIESSFAINSGSGWSTSTATHEVTSTSAYIYLYIGTTIPTSELDNYTYKYSTYLQLTYSYLEYIENGTPIHDTYLHSDTEIHIKDPINSLTIQDLVRCYPKELAQEWNISFKTGTDTPNIAIANNTNFIVRDVTLEPEYDSNYNVISYKEAYTYYTEQLPIKWLYAEPVFEANHRYLITFKQIIDIIYGVWTVLE